MHEMYERGGGTSESRRMCGLCQDIDLDKGQQTKINMHNDGLLVKKDCCLLSYCNASYFVMGKLSNNSSK